MAGGWSKRGSGIPLEDRVRVGDGRPRLQPGREESGRVEQGRAEPGRHCWVAGSVDGHGVERAGLLVEWRRGPSGWEGRVAYVADLRPDTPVLVEEWLPAALLTPQ